jgi:hypothetical protein
VTVRTGGGQSQRVELAVVVEECHGPSLARPKKNRRAEGPVADAQQHHAPYQRN